MLPQSFKWRLISTCVMDTRKTLNCGILELRLFKFIKLDKEIWNLCEYI